MPKLSQGNVFDAVGPHASQLGIVFGHTGFNEMTCHWRAFADRHPALRSISDPFTAHPREPLEVADTGWWWFVPDRMGPTKGLSDQDVLAELDQALAWAVARGLTSVATNGVSDTDLGLDSAANRRSHDRRVELLVQFTREAEQKLGIAIELVSMNDSFVRPRAETQAAS